MQLLAPLKRKGATFLHFTMLWLIYYIICEILMIYDIFPMVNMISCDVFLQYYESYWLLKVANQFFDKRCLLPTKNMEGEIYHK